MERDETYIRPLKSIRLKCLDCASTSNGVKACEFTGCPLYPLRFGKNIPKGTSRVKSIRKYCVQWCMNNQSKEVQHCPSEDCYLYLYRHGKNPFNARLKHALKSHEPIAVTSFEGTKYQIGGNTPFNERTEKLCN